MFVIIKDRRQFISEKIEKGSFTYKGLKIYENHQRFYLELQDGYCLLDGKKNIALKKGSYLIETPEGFYQLELYVYENAEGFDEYRFYKSSDEIKIAFKDADINYHDPNLPQGELYIKDGLIQSDLPFSVNDRQYDGFKLRQGDQIALLGLRIYYYEEFLYLNSFLCECRLEPLTIKEQKIGYARRSFKPRFQLKKERGILDIPELKEFEEPPTKSDRDIVKTILPNTIMSLSILSVSSISLMNAVSQGRDLTGVLSYIVSPVAMLITGVVLPFIFYKNEKKDEERKKQAAIDTYLTYLDDYEGLLDKQIEGYVALERERDYSALDEERQPFDLCKDDEDFLQLVIGRIYRKEPFGYRSDVRVIDERLTKIAGKLKNIGPLPLLTDLKEDKSLCIVVKTSEKDSFLNYFLLQLAYRHSYEDLYLALFSHSEERIAAFYDLPHLFYNGRRLYFKDERQLQELDRLKLDRPLVLFMCDKCEMSFINPQIHVLHFCEDLDDLPRDSHVAISYLLNTGILYKNGRQEFAYLKEAFDVRQSFRKLGFFNHLLENKADQSFRSVFENFDIAASYQYTHHDLRADFAYSGDKLLSFDLHETKQGPHGLIGGSTGSGKSELIVSLLLSLCIRYSPEYLSIVLIDYKGGGIRESLSNGNASIPHVVASVNNLENGAFQRLIIALKNECRKRQLLFNELSNKGGRVIMDLDAYLDGEYQRFALQKLGHLLIVVDEFAELKKEDPEGIKELISIARIGRSLGVHLILATQRPAGNIDDEIWSNSRFKIALKVYEEKDSVDLIHDKQAAYLKQPGSFVLKVDDVMAKGQSFYAKKEYNDHEPYEVCLLDPSLAIVKQKSIGFGQSLSCAAVFVEKIIDVCKKLGIKTEKLPFLAPEPLSRHKLAKGACFVFGEADDYIRSQKGLVAYGLNENILVCTSRKKEMAGLLNTLNENQKQSIVISHKRYEGGYISDSLLYEEGEDILYLFELLHKTNKDLTLLIEDLPCLLAYDDSYQERLLKLMKQKENSPFNIVALSNQCELSFKLLSSFKNRLLLGSKDSSEISYLFSSRSAYKGENFYYKDEPICFVAALEEDYLESERKLEPVIKRIPEVIESGFLEDKCLLGYDLSSRQPVYQKGDLKVVSYDEELLKVYRQAYGDKMETINYEKEKLKRIPEETLWLGSGIFAQRLFIAQRRDDLNDQEAIYIYKGKQILLRRVDHA